MTARARNFPKIPNGQVFGCAWVMDTHNVIQGESKMVFDRDMAEQVIRSLHSMSSAELAYVVSRCSGDYDSKHASTMQTMCWLWNTAPNDRTDPKADKVPFRVRALGEQASK